MADPEGSSSSEDGSEPMEVKIPPEIARELGQGPSESTMAGEEERVVDKPEEMMEEGELGAEVDTLDLKKIATDYAQYLAVNSRQDVSTLSLSREFCYNFALCIWLQFVLINSEIKANTGLAVCMQ
jgi:hypothetical protein